MPGPLNSVRVVEVANWTFVPAAGAVLADLGADVIKIEPPGEGDLLDELPEEQRDVFVANEIEGRTFQELSVETGVSINTLLSRKRYAVIHLRRRLQSIYDEFMNR